LNFKKVLKLTAKALFRLFKGSEYQIKSKSTFIWQNFAAKAAQVYTLLK